MAMHSTSTSENITQACKLVAQTYFGERGLWLCHAFEAINSHFFQDALPYPHIMVMLTAHGACYGWSISGDKRPPAIAIHPSVFGGTEKDDPWEVPPLWLGKRFAFDVLLHECIHLSVNYCLGGWTGESSHNNPQWIAEVNRLAPLLGFSNIRAGMSKPKRVPVDGPLTKRGKKPTAVQRVTTGNIPFDAVASFPVGLRAHLCTANSYYPGDIAPASIDPKITLLLS